MDDLVVPQQSARIRSPGRASIVGTPAAFARSMAERAKQTTLLFGRPRLTWAAPSAVRSRPREPKGVALGPTLSLAYAPCCCRNC
jgi:hypothetical protein